MKIDNKIIDILANSTIEDNKLFLPNVKLDRKLYLSVNKVLMALDGKWNRQAKAHIFTKSIQDILEEVILTGKYVDSKKEYQFFETPKDIAKRLIEIADIQEGESVLEPSAGKGAIASLINNCDCIELNKDNRQFLVDNGFKLVGDDFLSFSNKYDVIIANPPFSKQQDIDHINHMIDLANHKVVSIASSSVLFRSNKKTVDFRDRIEKLRGNIIPLPEKSFNVSGTNVNTCIVRITKLNSPGER